MKTTGSYKNIWHGSGRKRIEIAKSVLKNKVQTKEYLKQLYLCGLGYYPNASNHYTFRRHGLPENMLFYCVDGSGWYEIDNRRYEVGPNEFFILPKNMQHAYGSSVKTPWSIYWVHFSGESLSAFNEISALHDHLYPRLIRNNEEICSSFNKIYNALKAGYHTQNLCFANMCFQHFLSLFLYESFHTVVKSEESADDCIDKAIHFMKDNIEHTLSLADICRYINYSPSRFSFLFQNKTGYTPIDYFIHIKMQKATHLLDATSRSVKDIALSMGFTDPYYFSRRFKKATGMSPLKYRSVKRN